MEEEHALGKSPSASLPHVDTRLALLSPPYSPVRQRLQLLSLDELAGDKTTDPTLPEPQTETSSASSDALDESEWKDIDDVKRQEFHQEGLFGDLDEWEEPLFLGHPAPRSDESEGLDLTLFGPSQLVVTDSSQDSYYVPSSPSFQSTSLPDLDHVPGDGVGNTLLDPSDFDVFNNGWDTIVSEPAQKAFGQEQIPGEDLDSRPLDDFAFEAPPTHTTSPESPSRRSVIDLPGDEPEVDEPGQNLPLRPSSPINFPGDLPNTVLTSPWYRTFDVPLDIHQSPYSLPLLLSPPSPTQQSLLFAPPEPEDVPLPESPEDERHLIGLPDSDYDDDDIKDVPLHLLEETRLRVLHQESIIAEQRARQNESMLTEYIRRLNEMKPPQEQLTSFSHSNSLFDGKTADSSPVNAGPGPATLHFLQTRRKDVQHLVGLRAVERRKRKKAKERGRELETLLELKSAQLRADALLKRQRLRLASQAHLTSADAYDAVVLAASGSDCHQTHTRDSPLGGGMQENTNGSSRPSHQDEILQLVAKMIFRRRDSPRPLTGKALTLSRPYRRSSLSQEENIEIPLQDGDS